MIDSYIQQEPFESLIATASCKPFWDRNFRPLRRDFGSPFAPLRLCVRFFPGSSDGRLGVAQGVAAAQAVGVAQAAARFSEDPEY